MPLRIEPPDSMPEPVCRWEMIGDAHSLLEITRDERGSGAGGDIPEDVMQRLQGDIVEIGKPRRWDLQTGTETKDGSKPQRESKIWLVELSCSFLPAEEHSVTWARFVAHLSATDSPEQPQVLDVYPLAIHDPVEEDRKIGIGLDFKFAALVQAKVGDFLTEIKYKRLDPKVIATFGAERRTPTWNFSATPVSDVRGYKPLYMVVRMPSTARSLDVEFGLFSKVRLRWGVFPLTRKRLLGGQERITIEE